MAGMGSMSAFTITALLIVGLILYVFARALMSLFGLLRGKPGLVCTTCGYQGTAVVKTRGSIWLEIILWLLFIVPGLIYSVWRLTTRGDACASCGATTLVPATSPIGRKLIADMATPKPPADA
jgi:cellulose synthase/poly-beta-1,6-N-acetylglucosamine synthase-like glycosyltransferase